MSTPPKHYNGTYYYNNKIYRLLGCDLFNHKLANLTLFVRNFHFKSNCFRSNHIVGFTVHIIFVNSTFNLIWRKYNKLVSSVNLISNFWKTNFFTKIFIFKVNISLSVAQKTFVPVTYNSNESNLYYCEEIL